MAAVLECGKTRYRAASKFQLMRRDLAFVMPAMSHDDLLLVLKGAANKLVQEISVFDVYRGMDCPADEERGGQSDFCRIWKTR